MCCPTFTARAVTAAKRLQSSDEHTANVRRLPRIGAVTSWGVTVTAAAPVAGRDRTAPPRAGRVRPRRRSRPSNCTAVPVAEGELTSWATGTAAGPSVAVRSSNGEDWPNVPAADCGTIRYFAESSDEVLAAIVTHPPSDPGSSD